MHRNHVLIAFGLSITFFALFPTLDITVQQWLFTAEDGFFLRDHPLVSFVYHGVEWFSGGALLLTLITLVGGFGFRHPQLRKHGRAATFFFLAIVLGPGLLVNGVFKENWGRARPAQIQEFGGEKQYTPPLQATDQCSRNCSFTSGHASIGFVLLALGYAFPRQRRRWFAVGITFGLLVGLGRMMQGRHFLSDVIFSGLLVTMASMWLNSLMVYYDKPELLRLRMRRATVAQWKLLRAPVSVAERS